MEILSLDDVGIYGEIEENGETFRENAIIKARAAQSSGYISIGEDSGLSVNALGGEPGVYSARYAGEHGDDRANNELLLKKLEGKDDRSAKFVCTIACVCPETPDESHVFVGYTEGVIIDEYRGSNGFGYDPIFYREAEGKTFAEMTREEKISISHRGKAIEQFGKWLFEYEKTRGKI